ncbi:hypothetical protein V491_07784 [Pseudogymnoascus sp. VKM F-3775]|nr:hypothetical protein V491_07784 [Pseudogymnoascus sp. VKM F-3775]
MNGVTTPIKAGTETDKGSALISESHTSTETMPQGDNIFLGGDSSSTPSRPEPNSTPSTSSSDTSVSSIFSIQSNESTGSIGTSFTSTPAKHKRPEEPNAIPGPANPKHSQQSFVHILQGEKSQVNTDVSEGYGDLERSSLVYPGSYKFNFAPPGPNSPTPPCNVSWKRLDTAELHSREPEAPDLASNGRDPFSEFKDIGPGVPSQDASLETTSSLNTSSQGEVVSIPPSDTVTKLHGSRKGSRKGPQKAAARKSRYSIPEGQRRKSARLLQANRGTATASSTTETTGLNVEESYFSLNFTKVTLPDGLGEEIRDKPGAGTQRFDEDGATTDENQPPTRSNRVPSLVAQEANCDNITTEAPDHPRTNFGEKLDVGTTKIAGSMKFEQYEEMKSLTDIKIAILNVILQEDEKHTLDNKKGFVYMYKLNSSEGHIKIGKSNQKHGVRVQQGAKSCNLPFERISDRNDKKFLHYGIVEKLVHLELSNRRKKYECGMCKKNSPGTKTGAKATHGEWFEIEEKQALTVIERWRGWLIREQPYGKDGALRGIWLWKHHKLSEANTDSFEQWVIMTWSDWTAYAWYIIDDYLDKELPTMLRSSLFINATLIFVTRLWCVSGVFMSSVFTFVILAMFFKYS